jgi:hypothetical protein
MLKQDLQGKEVDLNKASAAELKEGKTAVCKKFLAALMLSRANGAKYNHLKQSLKEIFLTGKIIYPKSLAAVLCILNA